MEVFERLGQFYLGTPYDLKTGTRGEGLILYDSKDLTTHAFCVGMTGSGKTGLCITLLEEAAIDGIPSIVIDPKGDMGNLLLTFPELNEEDFRPWVSSDEARRSGLSVDEYAKNQAALWRKGLADWGQDGGRISRLRDAAAFTLFTPGSESGVPISVVSSFAAPPVSLREDAEFLRDRISSTATSLLGLLGIDADPLQSREHVLIANILETAWSQGQDLDLAGLIQAIQTPPMTRVGVFEVDAFYPKSERFKLALSLNNLLAAPGFEAWLTGEPLDVDRLLYTEDGRPRVSVISVAHLSDAERMFFVSLLLNETVGWIRSRPGAQGLRAILYMDEIFGFVPPVAEPPSKKPLLTLLKQARAFGLGVVLATQNPVDVDYKGLSNMGTWFLGRLQTERDRARLLDGLEGLAASSSGFDRSTIEATLAGLGKRVFLMHNVHEDEPVVFHTRWAMSYLRGPMTRAEIARLTAPWKAAQAPAPASPAADEVEVGRVPGLGGHADGTPAGVGTASAAQVQERDAGIPPVLPPSVLQKFLPVATGGPEGARLTYRPQVLGMANVHYFDRRLGVEHSEEVALLADLLDHGPGADWRESEEVSLSQGELEQAPREGVVFHPVPGGTVNDASPRAWERGLVDALYRSRQLSLLKSPSLGEVSRPRESERDFRIRLAEGFREARDEATEQLREKYAARVERLEERIRRAQQAVGREREQARQQQVQAVISVGATILGSFLGRKRLGSSTLGRATTAARGYGRAAQEAQDVARAEASVEALVAQLDELQQEFETEVDKLSSRLDHRAEELDTVVLKPLKRDVEARLTVLAWRPFWQTSDGRLLPAGP